MPRVEDPQLLDHAVIKRPNQLDPGDRAVERGRAGDQGERLRVTLVCTFRVESDALARNSAARDRPPDNRAPDPHRSADRLGEEGVLFYQASSQKLGRASMVLEGDHVDGGFGDGQPCAQQRGQHPAHVGERRRPNRRSEKIRARRQVWQIGVPERDRGELSYPTILGQIGFLPNPEPTTLIDRLDDSPAAGYQNDLPSRITQQRRDEAACHAPCADQQATRRAHVELSTTCGTLESRVSGEPKFAARSKMYSASRRSASGTPL